MSINLYQTQTMLAAIERMEPVHSFLRDRYFPTSAGDLFPTEEVLVEFKDSTNHRMAPVVMPRKGGITVERDGYSTHRMAPPLVAPQRPLTIDDLNKKGFGEELFSNITPAQRQADILGQDLMEFDQMITNREEYIAAKCLFENGYVLRQYADQYGSNNYEEYEMRFYEGNANPSVYIPGVKWNEASSNKMADLHIMVRMLTTAGLPATDLLLGADCAEALLADETIKKLLDITRYSIGQIAPQQMADGAALLGQLNIYGHMIHLITYDGTYQDEQDGKIKALIPAKSICLTAPNCGRRLYGAVTQMEETDRLFHTYMGTRVPKYMSDVQSEVRELKVSSRPLLIPRGKNPFVSAAVLD